MTSRVLIDYLVTHHGPMPEGPWQEHRAQRLHDVPRSCRRVRRNLATREDWEDKLGTMLNEGAPLSEQDFPIVDAIESQREICWETGCTGVRRAMTAAGQAAQPDKGEQIMNASCITCHDLRSIQVQALDKEGWTSIVDMMIQRGAEVKEDLPVLIEYLVTTTARCRMAPARTSC